MKLQEAIAATRSRLKANHLRLGLIELLFVAVWSGLLGTVVSFWSVPLAALVTGFCTLWFGLGRFRSAYLGSISDQEAAQKIDELLDGKERALNLVDIIGQEDSKAKYQLIESQLAPQLARYNPETALPFVMPAAHKKLLYTIPFALLILVLWFIFMPKPGQHFTNPAAAGIADVLEQHPELPAEVKESLEDLAQKLETEGGQGASSEDLLKAIENAESEIAKAQAEEAKLDESRPLNQLTPQAQNLPPLTPTPTPTPTPAPKEKEQQSSSQSSSADAQESESQEQKGGGKGGQGREKGNPESGQQGEKSEKNEGQSVGQGSGEGEKGENKDGKSQGTGKEQGQQNQDQKGEGNKGGSQGQGEQQSGEQKSQDQKQQQGQQNQQGQQQGDGQQQTGDGSKQAGQQGQQDKAGGKDGDKQGGQQGSGLAKAQAAVEQAKKEAGQQGGQGEGEDKKSGDKDKSGQEGGKGSGDIKGENKKERGASEQKDKSQNSPTEKSGEAGQALGKGESKAKRFAEGGEQGGGLGDNKDFKSAEIAPADEKLDQRFTGKEGSIDKNQDPAKAKTTLGDVKLAKPEIQGGAQEQQIPLEYKEMME